MTVIRIIIRPTITVKILKITSLMVIGPTFLQRMCVHLLIDNTLFRKFILSIG